MNTPLVSIISPTYNHSRYISECIRSVQAQTYDNWEMIILDDGSTDDTYNTAKSFEKEDSRIKVYTQRNVGVFKLGETYNRALALSRGSYVAILEGDDVWEPFKLMQQVKTMEMNPSLVMSWGQAILMNEDLSNSYYISPVIDEISTEILQNKPPGSIVELGIKGVWLPALTLLIRRSVLDEIGGFLQTDGMPLVDVPTILTLSKKGLFHFDNEVLGKWRIYANQTTKKYTVEIYLGMYRFLQRHLPEIYPHNKEKQSEIIRYYRQLCLISYARSGRYKLIHKDFRGARSHYIKAVFYPFPGKWVWRLRASVGYVMSLLHLDVEWLAHLLGRKTYKP